MASLRWRAALVCGTVLATTLPTLADAVSPPLTCRNISRVGAWQKIPVSPFHDVQGVSSTDQVTTYSLDSAHPGNIVATNGTTLKRSTHAGCDWADVFSLGLQPSLEVPLSGQTSKITSTAVLSGHVVVAVREGTSAAARPHIVVSDSGRPGTYTASDTGLPPQGAPKLLKPASDGHTVYLVLTPVAEDDSTVPGAPAPLPSLPSTDGSTSGGKAGLLYASTDGGHSWELRTSASDLPAGAGLDQLAVDRGDPNLLYARSNGLLYISHDGGSSFSRARINNEDVTAVEAMAPGTAAVFTKGGLLLTSQSGGNQFTSRRTVPGVSSAAWRSGDTSLAVELNGVLFILDPKTGYPIAGGGPQAVRGSLTGDVGPQSTFHGLSGHALLRYTDPIPPGEHETAVSLDDLGVPAPPPGRTTPASRSVQLKVGTSATYDYDLSMPKSPTPLDLFFLIDTSGSMNDYIENLKNNIQKVVNTIQGAGIDLRVGVGTLGTGTRPCNGDPRSCDPPTPYVNKDDPTDRGSKLYELFRGIGRPDTDFAHALQSVKVVNQGGNNPAEAQLAALEQATWGPGIKDPRSPDLAPVYIVQPGLDAGWRQAPGIRRLIVTATDEAFDYPVGSPVKNDGCGCHLDFDRVIAEMNKYRVQQIGLTTGAVESRADLAHVARGTHTFAPPGGVDCGEDEVLPAGSPLVCDTEGDFSAIIARLVKSLQDRADVSLTTRGSATKVIQGLSVGSLHAVDVTKPNVLPFRVAVTCQGLSPGTYDEDLVASLRGIRIASSHLKVDCLGPAAAARLLPPAATAAVVTAPVPPAPVAVVPAPPAAQPQAAPQAQAQTQMNPMTAAAMQKQEQLQLALALQAGEERPETETEMAMVSHRRRDEGPALALLATAMLASSALGLSRLRSKPAPSVVHARRR